MNDKQQVPSSEYSENRFWRKLSRFALKAGREVVQKALLLYFALESDHVPKWARTVIIGALAYFISPVDVVPDPLPVVGYADDLVILVAALGAVAAHIDNDIRNRADQKLHEWFQ